MSTSTLPSSSSPPHNSPPRNPTLPHSSPHPSNVTCATLSHKTRGSEKKIIFFGFFSLALFLRVLPTSFAALRRMDRFSFALDAPEDPKSLCPRTRGEALHNFANNFPIGTTVSKARSLVSENAVSAYLFLGHPHISRFPWLTSPIGPRETLMYVSNGPRHFASEWIRIISAELSSIELFASLPSCIVHLIIDLSFRPRSK